MVDPYIFTCSVAMLLPLMDGKRKDLGAYTTIVLCYYRGLNDVCIYLKTDGGYTAKL